MTQLYQSESLIGATLLSLLHSPPLFLSPSHTISSPRATWTGCICAPLKHSTVRTKPGRGRRWWWRRRILLEHNKQREVWMKTIRPFLTYGRCFMFIRTVRSLMRVLVAWNRLVSKSRQPVGVDVDTFPTGTGLFSRLAYDITCGL